MTAKMTENGRQIDLKLHFSSLADPNGVWKCLKC